MTYIFDIIVVFMLLFQSGTVQHKDTAAIINSCQLNTSSYSWQPVYSPEKVNLRFLSFFQNSFKSKKPSNVKAYLVGNKISYYDGNQWQFMSPQPPVSEIQNFFALAPDRMWITTNTNFYRSSLYYFDGKKWTKIKHLIFNQIEAMHFSPSGEAYLGGEREIVIFTDKTWKPLPYPDNTTFISEIYGQGNSLWVRTYEKTVHFYDGKKWSQILKGQMVKDFFFSDINSGYLLTESAVYKISGHTAAFHSKSPKLKDAYILSAADNKNIIAVGAKGIILHYQNGTWQKENSPVTENLQDIVITPEGQSWIIGNSGTLLHYTPQANSFRKSTYFGFNLVKLFFRGEDVTGEYGVGIEDFNNDGIKDIYAVCILKPHHLFKLISPSGKPDDRMYNYGYDEVAAISGLNFYAKETFNSTRNYIFLGVGICDIENDSDQDLYLCNLGQFNALYLNNGKGYFRDVSGEKNRATNIYERSNAAVFGDVDNDGDNDMFVTYEFATNRLFINDGAGYFEDITETCGLKSTWGSMGATFGDIDGDGDLDLAVANWSKGNKLYENISSKGLIRFRDISARNSGFKNNYSKTNGVALADIDNDADLDLAFTNRGAENRFYLNDGKGHYKDASEIIFGQDTTMSYGISFADFDHNGYQDIYIANIGNNELFLNQGGYRFTKQTLSPTREDLPGYGTGTAVGDIDNDGDVDLYAASYINSSSLLHLNTTDNKNFLVLRLKGTISNRDAIGAKVYLYRRGGIGNSQELLGFREVNGGSGYCSHNSFEVHFGIPHDERVDVVVYFPPTGIKRVLYNVRKGQIITVSEQEGFAATKTLFMKSLLRNLIDPEVHVELSKLCILLPMLFLSSLRVRARYRWKKLISIFFHLAAVSIYLILSYIFLYDTYFYSMILPLGSVLIFLSIVHLYYETVVMKRLAALERQATRNRIARDLHDDLASTISSSVLFLEMLRRNIQKDPEKSGRIAEKVTELLTKASEAITDLVWTVSPKHDRPEDLALRIRLFIKDICQARNVKTVFNLDFENTDGLVISDQIKRNVFLIFKEAIYNSLRHGEPSGVTFTAQLKPERTLFFELSDDGKGFDNSQKHSSRSQEELSRRILSGHGLMNMSERAREIGADLSISSSPGAGTVLRLQIKL